MTENDPKVIPIESALERDRAIDVQPIVDELMAEYGVVNFMRYAFELLEVHREELAGDAELMHILDTRRPEDYAVLEPPKPPGRRLRIVRDGDDD